MYIMIEWLKVSNESIIKYYSIFLVFYTCFSAFSTLNRAFWKDILSDNILQYKNFIIDLSTIYYKI